MIKNIAGIDIIIITIIIRFLMANNTFINIIKNNRKIKFSNKFITMILNTFLFSKANLLYIKLLGFSFEDLVIKCNILVYNLK